MSKCVKHIVENTDVQYALQNGDQNDFRTGGGDTDISMQDDSGSFDLRGIKCKRCGELVDIYYTQHDEDMNHVEISPDADDAINWEDPIGAECIEKHDTYDVFEIKTMVEKSDIIQKCRICGLKMNSFIMDHVKKEHPDAREYHGFKKNPTIQ